MNFEKYSEKKPYLGFGVKEKGFTLIFIWKNITRNPTLCPKDALKRFLKKVLLALLKLLEYG